MVYPVNRLDRLLKLLDSEWREFRESYAGLSDPELLQPGVTGSWSVRDIIAHVTTWEEEALKHLPVVLQGGKPPRYSVTYGGIDAFNARAAAGKKDLSLSEVLRQRDDTHRRLIEFLKTVPEEHLVAGTRFRSRLRLDTYSHYARHMAAIRKWRTQIDD